MHTSFKYCLIAALTLLMLPLSPIDNPHFYRATNALWCEPRIEHDWLSSFDITVAGGSTHSRYNRHHDSRSLNGTFSIIESNLSYTQNLSKGLVLFFHIPIRKLSFSHQTSTHETGAGDFTTLIGWTHNYQKTKTLDFIDGTLAAGVLAPTGKKRNPNQLFSLPLGYNGHWGFPITAMLSLGTYEWITIGAYAHGLFFSHKNTIWNTGIYTKADHFMYGLSFCITYSYAGEVQKWNMHTLQFCTDYDFAKHNSTFGPRIGAFYNYQVRGKRTFKTNMAGGSFGLEICWDA